MYKINIITVLCEGPHDVAFISKILKANGYNSNDRKKIEDYPIPYNMLLENEAKKSNIQSLNIQELRSTLLPSSTLEKGNCQLFLYALGGDSRKDKRQELLKQIDSFIPKNDDEYPILPAESKLTLLYFFDADDKGVKTRFGSIAKEIKEIIKDFDDVSNFDKPIKLFNNKLTIGAFIFKKKGKNSGKLEDILLPLMKKDNDTIFKDAELFIDKSFDSKRITGNNFNKEKAIIGTVGQLQKSGGSNVVCISQTDYLNKTKIIKDDNCIDIVNFFKIFM